MHPRLSLVPETTEGDLEGFAFAFTTLDDIADEIAQGPSASLIYVEGELALYLDEDDTEDALREVSDRDIAIMQSLVVLASQRLNRELSRRHVNANIASSQINVQAAPNARGNW